MEFQIREDKNAQRNKMLLLPQSLLYLNTKSYHKNDLPRSRVKNITKTKIN